LEQKPLIGVTCRTHVIPPGEAGADSGIAFLGQKEYVDAVVRAGGNPVFLPSVVSDDYVAQVLRAIDGVLATGGNDDDPGRYGQEPHAKLGFVDHVKGRFESALLRGALEAGLPILGICGGHQALNTACGGTLHQDIAACTGSSMAHVVRMTEPRPCHTVDIAPGSRLFALYGAERIRVNSTHHQAVDKAGKGLSVTAHAPDSVVEAIERAGEPFVVGVQWHPERLAAQDEASQRLFDAFVEACRTRRMATATES
jgi:putative glutamine amidotransferase